MKAQPRYRVIGNVHQQNTAMQSRGSHSLGRAPGGRGRSGSLEVLDASSGIPRTVLLEEYTQVPAVFVAEANLGIVAGDVAVCEGAQLRPEQFLLKRITWASSGIGLEMDDRECTTIGGQAPLVETCPGTPLPIELFGRSILVKWGDEFTKFLGRNAALMSAIFGDSNGFLDLTREVLFAGKQTLTADLERVFTLPGVTSGQTELVQVIFHGTGLLPLGVNESGSL